jgi:hypothetical protein
MVVIYYTSIAVAGEGVEYMSMFLVLAADIVGPLYAEPQATAQDRGARGGGGRGAGLRQVGYKGMADFRRGNNRTEGWKVFNEGGG